MPAAVLVAAGVAGSLWWLLATMPPAAPDATNTYNETLRTALAAGAGVGAAITLMLAFRRQRHQELTALRTDHDATERRVTELFTKAVEQLGNDKAPVRLGGLYSLERLAQDNPDHRQTIVNVICAYLRMPYAPPPGESGQDERPSVPRITIAGASKLSSGHGSHEERQVRLTAQRILQEHLRDDRPPEERESVPTGNPFWPGKSLDLTGATLININFTGCRFVTVDCSGATFNGPAGFGGATFNGTARFGEVTFNGTAAFEGVTFNGLAAFGEATFNGSAGFGGTTFSERVWFEGTTFNGSGWFGGATFNGPGWFGEATFNGPAGFGKATFNESAGFRKATFNESARFRKANFNGPAWFGEANFNGPAGFGKATFSESATFIQATFSKSAWFGAVTFSERVRFRKATFNGPAGFEEATFNGPAGFEEANFNGPAGFEEANFNGPAAFEEATFSKRARFTKATFNESAGFTKATFKRIDFNQAHAAYEIEHAWPAGWCVRVEPDGVGRLEHMPDQGAPEAGEQASPGGG
ncbi:pentapeptide repeat-containing protein [Streptosporangium soli]|nr:pentapeptide repeat-containing protein [Streptosporangium sp. KLBMP 9127]